MHKPRNEIIHNHVTHNLKKNIAHILILVIGLAFSNLYGQNYAEFETELIKHHGMKDTLRGDNLWIYDKEFHKIKKTELTIFENSKVDTYLVEMTWYLGYHVDEINCLFTFEPETKELKFVGDITANGFKPEFYDQLIGYSLPNEKSVKKFITDFEELIKINNPGVKFENAYYEDGRTVFFRLTITIQTEKEKFGELSF